VFCNSAAHKIYCTGTLFARTVRRTQTST